MNNNRGNNRRRGRGNNNRQQGGGGGGGQHVNRIDSRARGNAPQLLEKYRKLAHDAHLNGDRVTEEYYLQFADHYFRVIADQRQRQEEQRARREDRWQDGETQREEDDGIDYGLDGDDGGYDPQVYPPRRDERSADRPERGERREREDRPREDRSREDRPRRAERAERAEESDGERSERSGERTRERVRRQPAEPRPEAAADPVAEATGGEEQPSLYEPAENPFVRESRGTRGLRPRREDRRPRRDAASAEAADGQDDDAPAGLDASLLPPSIATVSPAEPEEPVAEKPKRPRGRPRKTPPADDTLAVATPE